MHSFGNPSKWSIESIQLSQFFFVLVELAKLIGGQFYVPFDSNSINTFSGLPKNALSPCKGPNHRFDKFFFSFPKFLTHLREVKNDLMVKLNVKIQRS